jgi:hypothetical protein
VGGGHNTNELTENNPILMTAATVKTKASEELENNAAI